MKEGQSLPPHRIESVCRPETDKQYLGDVCPSATARDGWQREAKEEGNKRKEMREDQLHIRPYNSAESAQYVLEGNAQHTQPDLEQGSGIS